METDWDAMRSAAYEALKNCLALEDPKFQKGGDDVRALAGRMVEFWRAELKGGVLTGNLLSSAIHRARLLCETYDVTTKGKPVKVQRLIQDFAFMGTEFLKAFGGTDGKAKE